MPNKFELLTKVYDGVCKDVIRSPKNWCDFLSSACFNYRLRFDEQLLISAQRPDATAVLEFEKWNKRFNRKINKNAKGIAVFADVERTKIKHYFDISDTRVNPYSRPVPIWNYQSEYENDVIETLESSFGNLSKKEDIADAVISATDNATEDNITDYLSDLLSVTYDSFLEELDDDMISSLFNKIVKNSIAFMVLTRLGINADEYFTREDFEGVVNFNTPDTLNALGYATSDIAEMTLNEVSKTVLSIEKENRIIAKSDKAEYTKTEINNIERSVSNDTNHLQTTGRSADTELGTSDTEEFDIEQIWAEPQEIPQGKSQSDLLQSADKGQARQPSARGGRESEINGEIIDEKDVGTGGIDRGTESNRPNGLGAGNEQSQTKSTRDSNERGSLQPVTDELPSFINNDLIIGMLENPDDDLVHRKSFIAEQFKKLSESERIPYTQTIYGGRFSEYKINNTTVGLRAEKDGLLMYEGTFESRTKESVFSWSVVAELLGQLIDEGKYLDEKETPKEQTAQIGLFDYITDIPEEQYVDESNQVSLFTDFGISQQIIDEALCCGFNDKDSRLQIAMHFRRDRGVEYNTKTLKKLYGTNGAGFIFNGEQVSFWYDENGFNVAKGNSAKTSRATHLTWEQVAIRIRELLDVGRYMPQYELDKVEDYELEKVADRLTEFVRSMPEEYVNRDIRFNSIKNEIKDNGSYPARKDIIKKMLIDDKQRQVIFDEYADYMADYNAGMRVVDYNYAYGYNVEYVNDLIEGMKREPIQFTAEVGYLPDRKMFISQDEIDKLITKSKSNHEYRLETYTYFVNHPDKAERVKYISRDNQSGSFAGNDNRSNTSKGIEFSHGSIMEPYAKVLVKWNEVASRIDTLIKQNKFVTQEDIDAIPGIYKNEISRDLESFFEGLSENDAKPYPNDIESYKIRNVIKAQLDNPQALDDIENMMSNALALMDKESRMYPYHKKEYEDFVAFKNGTYALYKTPEKAEAKPPRAITSKFSKPAEKEIPEWLTEYREIKAENPQALVFYQQGDFYETFEDDAVKTANELDLVLTGRHINENKNERIAMCGFPKSSLERYMKVLADKGYRVAVSSIENGERKTVWYAPDYHEENETLTEAEQEAEIKPEFTVPVKVNPYSFDLHPEVPTANRHDYNFREKEIETVGKKERFRRNMAAINVLKECEFDNRFATPEEQEILSGYVGWGGIAEAFDENNDAWSDEFTELYTTLSPTEYEAARRSTLTAFYTPQPVISAIYKVLDKLGFKQGNILEPCCAIGNFIGMLPDNMKDSKMYGVEIDNISAGIAQQLYQTSSIMTSPFEKAELPDSFFDAVVGNVPFGDFSLADKKYDKHHFLIHDYFFAKSLDKLRPGGVMCLVTSKGTMDKENSAVRRYIAQRAELIGAIRLPNNTFKGNAGTEVVSDILILQKRDRIIDIEPDWVQLDDTEDGIRMNKYFVDNPDMVLGNMEIVSGRFGEETTCTPYEDRNLEELLDVAVQNIDGEYNEIAFDDIEENNTNYIPADLSVRNFSFTVVDGTIYYRENSVMREIETSETGKNRIKGMIEIRDCVKNLLEIQSEDYPDEYIEKEQHRLNEIYDKFVKKYGYINSRGNSSAFSEDSSYFLICSLEVFKNDEFERKADIFTKRTIQPHIAKTHADTSIEAYGISIGEKAKVDMPFMCQLTGKTEEEIFSDLNGVIFLNPDYDESHNSVPKYLPADEYLSGNVRRKLRQAKEIAENDDRFTVNVDALEKVQPIDLKPNEIEVHLGVTWFPVDIVNKFMHETFNTPYYAKNVIKAHYNEIANVWNIENKSADNGNITVTQKYGTSRKNAFHILEATLNLRNVRVFDYKEDENGKRVAVLNKKETAIAQSKQELIKQTFKEWIWKDPDRREYLCKLYNEKFNSIRTREYDGSHIVFEGMNPEITLREHQKNAVARIIYGGNTLLAHCVGAGKTYTMAASAMERKRLGLCSKSLFVVPNHLVSQWASEFLTLYPSAKILATTKKDFETKNRKKFCGRIATGDYDAIIIGHSQFEKIPVSVGRQMFTIQKQIDEIVEGISELKARNGEKFTVKQLEATVSRLESKLKKLNDQSDKDDVITFEELGVDSIYVDEAHYYKNLFVYSKMRNVGGISQVEANKSSDMFMKCQYLDEITGSKGTIFATGTPISNSMVELYTMQRYLQYDLLKEYGYINFDSWAAQYGETVTTVELTPEGTGYRSKVRFARFNNLPELMSMFKECADIQTSDMLELPVPNVEYHNVSVKPSEFQVEMVEQLGKRAEKIRDGSVKPYEDNMLNITNDGRKLALDQRLINPALPDFEGSKVNECVRNVYDVWSETSDKKSTQLVFCDLSTPNNKPVETEVADSDTKTIPFQNIYDDLRNKLIEKGIPPEEIAFIHEANNDKQKADLFAKVRAGTVRILLGSTQKMGAGTNVQDKIIASHDIDCPWRPSDLEQRAGRTVRQGNENDTVHIYRYVTENTFDAYLYQLLETKQKFVGQVMTSKTPVRSIEDVDEAALSYAEIKMLATGNPHIKEKMDLDMQVQNLLMLKSNFYAERYELEDKVTKQYPQDIAGYKSKIQALKIDIETASKSLKATADYFNGMDINGEHYTEKKAAGEAIITIMKSFKNPSETLPVGSYRGFNMEMYISRGLRMEYILAIRGAMTHIISLGTDALGNITRIDNCIDHLAEDLKKTENYLAEKERQLEIAKESLKEPFSRAAELEQKQARLNELNALLNVDKKDNEIFDEEPDESEIKTKSKEKVISR